MSKQKQIRVSMTISNETHEAVKLVEDYFEAPISKVIFSDVVAIIKEKVAKVPSSFLRDIR